jgi:hypothetical protein
MRQRSWRFLKTLSHAGVLAVLACPAFAQSPIVIVSPVPYEFVDARLPYTVRWEAPDLLGNAGFFVYYVHAAQQQPICEAPPPVGDAGAPHVSVFLPTSPFSRLLPLSFVRRASEGGETTATIGLAVGEPVWIRLRIDDGTVRASYREAANAPWRFLGETRVALGARFDVGFAVTSVADGSLTRATFDRVAIEQVRR